jgi:hypothetical protein
MAFSFWPSVTLMHGLHLAQSLGTSDASTSLHKSVKAYLPDGQRLRGCLLHVLGPTVDLTTLGYALRVRWECLAPTDPQRLWTPMPTRSERIVKAMFQVSVTV